MEVKHAVLPDEQPPTVAFTVLAQLCGPKANEMEMVTSLLTEITEALGNDQHGKERTSN